MIDRMTLGKIKGITRKNQGAIFLSLPAFGGIQYRRELIFQ